MIRGFFAPDLMPQPLVQAVVVPIPSLRPEWVPVPFVLDTGAPVTCIHADDAHHLLGMPYTSLDPNTWDVPSAILAEWVGACPMRCTRVKSASSTTTAIGTLCLLPFA